MKLYYRNILQFIMVFFLGVLILADVNQAEAASSHPKSLFIGGYYRDMSFMEENPIFATIDHIVYHLSESGAHAISADLEADVLRIPSEIKYQNKTYRVYRFSWGSCYAFRFNPDRKEGKYREVVLPDTIEEVSLYSLQGIYGINIPKHARFEIDFTWGTENAQVSNVENTNFTVPEDHDYYVLKNDFLHAKKDACVIYYYLGSGKKVVIPKGTKRFGVFPGNRSVQKLVVPKTLQTVEKNFARRTGIRSIDLSKTKLKSIPIEAFYGCKKLRKIKLPTTLQEIWYRSFYDTKITTLTIPRKVRLLKEQAFAGMWSLKKITFLAADPDKKRMSWRGNYSKANNQKQNAKVVVCVRNRKMKKYIKKHLKKVRFRYSKVIIKQG